MTNVYAEDVGWLDVGPSRPISVVLDAQGVLREFTVGARDFAGFVSAISAANRRFVVLPKDPDPA